MKRIAIAAAAVLTSGSAAAEIPSPQEIFCAELKRVIEVAELDGDFTYLERSRAAPPRLGFAHGCQATGDEKKQYWACGQSLAPDSLSRDRQADRISACLPEAARSDRSPWRETVFTLPYAEIRVSESGGPGAHVGRIAELVVEATQPPD